jgi:uncharacterized iron-regulated protein
LTKTVRNIRITGMILLLVVLGGLNLFSPRTVHSHSPSLQTSLMPYPFWTAPEPEDIYHIPTGLKLSFGGMMDMIADSRLIFVGEAHNNIHAHRVQLEIIREMQRRFPGRIAIGMEMFRFPQQEGLDRWTRGELTEAQFLKETGWYGNWHSDFGYYREILHFARDHGIDVVALNPPRDIQRLVGMSRGEEVPAELEGKLPETDSSDRYQREVMKAIFSGHEGGGGMFDPFLNIQLLWEETMASRIVEYLGNEAGEGKKMVVLAGGMHVEYGFGVPKKVVRRRPMPYSIVLSSATSIPEDKKEEVLMDVEIPGIPLLSGDFLWMVPYEDLEDDQVRLGIVMTTREGLVAVEKVLEGSAAEAAGIRAGDELISLDGLAVEEMSDVVIAVRSKNPGDEIRVVLRRNGEELSLTARFPSRHGKSGEE